MGEKELKELLLERLHIELQLFKDSMLHKAKEDIFQSSYEIEVMVNLYEILAAHTEKLESGTVRGILNLNFGILGFIYQEWLGQEDSFYGELKEYACSELATVSELGKPDDGKDDKDGKEPDKAA